MKMNIRKITSFLVFHVATYLAGFTCFVLLFHTSLFHGAVFFYRGILYLVLISAVMAAILSYLTYKGARIDYRDILLSVTVFFCITLVFFTHIPVTADRSMSIFLLGYMNKNKERVVTRDELLQAFTDSYIAENGALGKRFDEQLQTGTIRQSETGFRLTSRGIFLMRFYAFIADIFGIGKKNLSR